MNRGRLPNMNAVFLDSISFTYPGRSEPTLDIEGLAVGAGEKVFLKGASGSGKSTLLGLIAGILQPDRGSIEVLDTDLTGLSAARRDRFRAENLGVIFQMFNLLPYLPAGENILLAGRFASSRKTTPRQARNLMDRLGLDPKETWSSRPGELSVGQQQRIAVARALIGEPRLILADEPTSSLDEDSRDQFLTLLLEECRRTDAALVFVSHDGSLARHFDRSMDLKQINGAAR